MILKQPCSQRHLHFLSPSNRPKVITHIFSSNSDFQISPLTMVNSTFDADLQTSVHQRPTFADTAPHLELLRSLEHSKSYSPSYSAFNTQLCAHK